MRKDIEIENSKVVVYHAEPIKEGAPSVDYQKDLTSKERFSGWTIDTEPPKNPPRADYLSQERMVELAHRTKSDRAEHIFEVLETTPGIESPGGRIAFEKEDGSVGYSGIVSKRFPPFKIEKKSLLSRLKFWGK